MSDWLGLNWVDFAVNIVVLALLPGLFAAYGGYLAAEAIQDTKRQRNVKGIFWLMFAVFVLATGWQQFRVAESELGRDTKETWADSLALKEVRPNLAPPLFAYLKTGVSSGTTRPPRSYIVFVDTPHFPQETKNSQMSSPVDFKPGDDLAFNVSYRQSGPNPLQIINMSRWLYTEPDFKGDTQQSLIADFKKSMQRERKSGLWSSEPSTLGLGDGGFFTAFAQDGKVHRKATQEELERLRAGAEIAFIIANITYTDLGIVHHLRRCLWLQPPAAVPGVWHFCDGFNNSD